MRRLGQLSVSWRRNVATPGSPVDPAVAAAIDAADVVLALTGPHWAEGLTDDSDTVRQELEQAIARGTPVIPVLLDGAERATAASVPASLSGVPGTEPVAMSDGHWDADVERLVGILDAFGRRGRLRGISVPRKRWSISAALGIVGAILGIMSYFGYFDDPEVGSVAIEGRTANVALERHLRGARHLAKFYTEPGRTDGWVYRVRVELDRAEGDRYRLLWTLVQPTDETEIEPFVDRVGDDFAAGDAGGIHRVWTSCAPQPQANELFPFRVAVSLVRVGKPERPLATAISEVAECREREE